MNFSSKNAIFGPDFCGIGKCVLKTYFPKEFDWTNAMLFSDDPMFTFKTIISHSPLVLNYRWSPPPLTIVSRDHSTFFPQPT